MTYQHNSQKRTTRETPVAESFSRLPTRPTEQPLSLFNLFNPFNLFNRPGIAALLFLALTFGFTASLQAQFPGGGFQFGGGQNNNNRSRSTGGQYPNNQVGDAVISIDPETRSLIVIADEETSQYISQVVSNLDRPKPQVLIKVVFLEVTRNDSLDIGIEGTFGKDIGNNGITSAYLTNFAAVPTTTSSGFGSNFNSGFSIFPTNLVPLTRGVSAINSFGLGSAGGPAGLYQIFSEDYTATIRAIATQGKAKILSRPSVVARNNQPATITVGQSVPLITSVRFDNFGNAINSVTYQSVGIILRVTPFITAEGLVEMILSPETSELVQDRTQWVPISSGPGGQVSAPLINSRSADTVVVTPDSQTVVIGGLMQNGKAESETKIPFVGDIPLLGNLFKHKITTDAKTELIIFLTPYIIHSPAEMASISDREREKSDATKALTERELNKFLDTLPATNQPPKSVSPKKHK